MNPWQSMKAFSLSLLLAGSAIPVMAQGISSRYPTTGEMQRLSADFRKQINYWNQYPQPEKREQAKRVAANWAKRDRAVAPFLGNWGGFEESLEVFPGKQKNQVCMVESGIGYIRFRTGTIRQGKLYTNAKQTILKQGDYLGLMAVPGGRPSVLAYRLVSPVQPVKADSWEGYEQEAAKVRQQFKAAGCRSI